MESGKWKAKKPEGVK